MNRHPEYKYHIERIREKDSWIFISDKEDSGWGRRVLDAWDDEKDDGPTEFILRIKEDNNWNVEKMGEMRYRFKQDDFEMIFQWDDLFGFVVSVEDESKLNATVQFIKQYTD